MTLSQLNLNPALELFVVANTPLFLLRKLKQLSIVSDIQKHSVAGIASALQKAIAKKPTRLEDYVVPYLYLIALARKGDLAALGRVASWQAPHHDWYAIVADALVKEARATTVTSFQIQNVLPASTLVQRSSLPASISALKTSGQ